MRRLNDIILFDLGMKLSPISNITNDSTYGDVLYALLEARAQVQYVMRTLPLKVCRDAASRLVNAISSLVPDDFNEAMKKDGSKRIDFYSYLISNAKDEFQTVLSAELSSLDSYLLTQQGIYNTADLVERADEAFSEEARGVISEEARKDFREGGRCLAFELPTASGFHVMRAAEAVLRQYHRLVKELPETQKSPDMATCINELRAAKEDPKAMGILDQIRDLHRNPQMHPEVFLSMDEAQRLFDISKSAISAMADRILKISKERSKAATETTTAVAVDSSQKTG